MSKLKLDLDDLAVETFETAQAARAKREGTVRGHEATQWNTCQGPTCDPGNTCWDSCDGVCGTYFCAPTEGSSCQQATCIINTCQSCAYTCAC